MGLGLRVQGLGLGLKGLGVYTLKPKALKLDHKFEGPKPLNFKPLSPKPKPSTPKP